MMKNLTKTLLLTSVFATASVIAMEEYNNGENHVQQPVRSQEMEAFRSTAEAVLGDDWYLNYFLQTEEPTIESLVRYSYLYAGYYGDDVAQQIHTALGNHANGMTVEDIQGIIDRVKQER